jgi:hypothetical protein
MTTERIDLPGGESAEIRVSLTGADQRDFFVKRAKLTEANGTGSPARTEPDPGNPAQTRTVPAVPARLTVADNFALYDWMIARLVTSCTMEGVLPWKPPVTADDGQVTEPGTRDLTDLDVVNALDKAAIEQMNRLLGIAGPKREPASSGAGSATTSAAATAPAEPAPAAPAQVSSSTPPAS